MIVAISNGKGYNHALSITVGVAVIDHQAMCSPLPITGQIHWQSLARRKALSQSAVCVGEVINLG